MTTRQYVPSALRSELTEYSSLLRALRTNNILDVSVHLTRHARDGTTSTSNTKTDLPSLPATLSPTPPETTESAPTKQGSIPAEDSHPNRKRKQNGSSRKRDNWTRWPLLLTDLPKPTWSFEDEVAALTSHASKLFAHSIPSTEPHPGSGADEGSAGQEGEDAEMAVDGDDLEVPSYYKFIAASTSEFLTNMLVLLSLHIPPRPPSMQNRIEPLDWRSVLEIFSVYGDSDVVDESIINKVTARMESLYEFSTDSSIPKTEDGENLIAYRVGIKNKGKQRLEQNVSTAFDGLFTLPPPEFYAQLQASRKVVQPKPKVKAKARAIKKPKENSKTRYKTLLTHIPSEEELEEEAPLAMVVGGKPRRQRSTKEGKGREPVASHESIRETNTATYPLNNDSLDLPVLTEEVAPVPEPESESSSKKRKMPSRKARSATSYSVPGYYKSIMGGRR